MGKRNYGNGIIDRRYRNDGGRTDYRGDLPFRVYCHYRDEQYSRCFGTYKEAEDWKRDQDEQDRNRDNIGYINRKETEKLRGIKVSDVIYRAMKRIGEGMGDTYTLLGLHPVPKTPS